MNYNFDQLTDRRQYDPVKWDCDTSVLTMWVADMDFETAPEIKSVLKERVNHGIFGYTDIPDRWYQLYQDWWQNRHHLTIEKDWLVYASGVIPVLSSSIRRLSAPGENVLVMTPAYNIFRNCIVNNGRNMVECPLVCENTTSRESDEDMHYLIDFDAMDSLLSNPQTSLLLLCNPQNPTGRIWTAEELDRIGELCEKHGVLVISDEIHCDILRPGASYVPFASVNDRNARISITAIAPTKCFNIAGIPTAAALVPDSLLRHKVWRQLNTDECGEPNAFSIVACDAAFSQGENWLNAMNRYVWENKLLVEKELKKLAPELKILKGDSTYLMWIDVRAWGEDDRKIGHRLKHEAGVWLSYGSQYGNSGKGFLRLNVATQRERVLEGISRIAKGHELFLNH